MPLPKRKHPRLRNWDYNSGGAYFITICTHDKAPLFGQIQPPVVGAIHESPASLCRLSPWGNVVEQVLYTLPRRFPDIRLEKYVIMPNHLHLLLCLDPQVRALREAPLQNKRSRVSNVIGYLKMNVSKEIRNAHPGQAVWQRSFHDHIIRSEADYLRIWQYIDTNPIKWTDDCFYVSDKSTPSR